jgi:flagellar basal-body rod protein FlgB
MSNWLVDPTQRILAGALDGLALREQAVAANLSNIDTPGYQAETVDFESELQAQLADSTSGAMNLSVNAPTLGQSAALGLARTASTQFSGTSAGDTSVSATLNTRSSADAQRADNNTVNLDEEMTALAETQLKFTSVSRMISGRFGMLRDVASSR